MRARYALALCESCDGCGTTEGDLRNRDCQDCLGTGYAEPQKRILNLQSEISELWYEREAAKAAIKALQRELAEARYSRDEWSKECETNMALLKFALEAGEQAIRQRDTLAEALESMWPFIEEDDHPNCNTPAFNAAIAKYKAALAAVKGGSDE